MKICWDNLEKLRYSQRTGKWYYGQCTYIYVESCEQCGEPYLKYKDMNNFCSRPCSMTGRKHSEESKKKMSKSHKGKISGNNKGNVEKNNIPLYDTYAHQIDYVEKVRRNPDDENILEVKCAYCGKWYVPKKTEIVKRIQSLNVKRIEEDRLYCSVYCKKECPIYWQIKYPKGYKKASSREVQPELRHMVLERDNWTCQKCGSTKSLHCHHVEGIRWEPLESADIDKCITYCKKCHKEAHKIEECGYYDMQCGGVS